MERAQREPALLFAAPDGPAGLDLEYLRQLTERGFQLDLTQSLAELDDERLRPFDVVVLFATPEEAHAGSPPDGRSSGTFRGAIDRFVRRGGGVLLMPAETNLRRQRLAGIYDSWGAVLPAERIVEQDARHLGALPNTSYPIPIAWTDQVASGPVTAGVRQIWYPIHAAFLGATTLPLVVDETWQVVVRASQTAVTVPIDLSQSSEAAPRLFQRDQPARSPAIFAVRAVDRGRAALTGIWPQFAFVAGTKQVFSSTILRDGINGIPSDFDQLLQNTLRWLAEPSLRKREGSGWLTKRDLLDPMRTRRDTDQFRAVAREIERADELRRTGSTKRVYRGLIGARTMGEGAPTSVTSYASAARDAGLDFVVFLEPFESMNSERLAGLERACAEHSGPDLLLLPGLSMRNNIGNRMFMFAPKPVWPPAPLLTRDGSRLVVQQEHDGRYTGYAAPFGDWLMQNYGHDVQGQVGYYDFAHGGSGMRASDLRLYGALGVRFYHDSQLVEELEQAYLEVSQGTFAPAPFAIHETSSLPAFVRAARNGTGLTYVAASDRDPLGNAATLKQELRWSTQYEATSSFVSTGPRVIAWPQTHRTLTFGAEGFSPERSLLVAPLIVESEKGLNEISLFDGALLVGRIALQGVRRYEQVFLFDGSLQRNLTAIVRDRAGHSAVSSPLRSWAEGSLAPVFCSDRTNDCGPMRLARGPWWLPLSEAPAPSLFESGRTWDGGPTAHVSALGEQRTLPILTAVGSEPIDLLRLRSRPLLEFSDEGAVGVQALRDGSAYARELPLVINPWNSFGPLASTPMALTDIQRYRQWQRATRGPVPYVFGAYGMFTGVSAALFTQTLTSARPTQVRELVWSRFQRVPRVRLVIIEPSTGPIGELPPEKAGSLPVAPGQAVAALGPQGIGTHVLVNRGEDVVLNADASHVQIVAAPGRSSLDVGADYTFELASHAFPSGAVTTPAQAHSYLAYLEAPEGLDIQRGRRLASPGLLEVAVDEGAAMLQVAKTPSPRFLPLRLSGLNPRWSAGLHQLEGYSAGFYGSGAGRYRSLAVDQDGHAYVPLHVDLARYRIDAGHPVVADSDGTELHITVVNLGGATPRWQVAVNNPSRRSITTRVRVNMPLPGLSLAVGAIRVAPGEYRLLH